VFALTEEVIRDKYADVLRALIDEASRSALSRAEVRVAGGTLILNAHRESGDAYSIEWIAPGDIWGRVRVSGNAVTP
jgi:hypothetical protein